MTEPPPVSILTARLFGGLLNGIVVEIEAGCHELSLGPMLALFGATDRLPPDEVQRLQTGGYTYRFARLEPVPNSRATSEASHRAVFDFVREPTASQ